jgi:hypothetical protein
MMRKYRKLVYESSNQRLDVEEAIALNEVTKTYYLADGKIGKVCFFRREKGLYKVSYRELLPPYDDILRQHFEKHPGVVCEFFTPREPAQEGITISKTRVYEAPASLCRQFELYFDATGRLIKQIEIGLHGQWLSDERPIYGKDGYEIGMESYDISGKFINRHLYADDW